MEMRKEQKCENRINEHLESRLEDINKMYEAGYYMEDDKVSEDLKEELPGLYNYGLCIDEVKAGTFKGQRENYKRWQLGWGGPSDEFRIYENGEVEYWFLDWFDGASRELNRRDADMIKGIINI